MFIKQFAVKLKRNRNDSGALLVSVFCIVENMCRRFYSIECDFVSDKRTVHMVRANQKSVLTSVIYTYMTNILHLPILAVNYDAI
jgi:hypothetical protein